ncbi:hypothetical protein HYT56_05550, partial [Candidatus Woesearchaeota archaeon]|nr:hypothetical protein [Candidatus Woesearchaeota archaeon]
MADLGIHDNEFINLDSHDSSTEKKIFKDFGENLLQSIKNRINYLSNSLYKIGKGFSSITGAAIGIQDYRTQDAGDDLTEGLTTYEYTPNTNPSEFYLTNTSGSLVPYIYENLGGGNRLIRIKDNNGEQRYLFNFGGIYLSKDGQVQAHFDFFKLEFYNNSVDEWQTT